MIEICESDCRGSNIGRWLGSFFVFFKDEKLGCRVNIDSGYGE